VRTLGTVADPGDLWGEQARLRPHQVALDVVLAGLFTLLALVTTSQQSGLIVAATLAMGAALVVRRMSWPLMAVLAVGTGVLQLLAGELALVADAGYAAVCFVLGAHPRSWVRRLGLAGVLTAAVVLATAVGRGTIGDAATGSSQLFAVLGSAALATLVAGGGWAAGYVRWQSRSRIHAQVQAGLERERTRIAADMHDLVAHTWAVVAAQADGARYSLGGSHADRRTADALDVIAETARGSIADLRDLLGELRRAGPAAPPGQEARAALVSRVRASGMDLRLVEHGRQGDSGELAVAARRLLAESLTNALKHGDLTQPVHVEEDWRRGYGLVVRNRVLPHAAAPGTGHGLVGMRDRVASAGGIFEAGALGDVWTVRLQLPEPGR